MSDAGINGFHVILNLSPEFARSVKAHIGTYRGAKQSRHSHKGEDGMENDPEKQLYQDMADLTEKVPKIQGEVKSLKTRLKRLAGQVEQLDLINSQNQIVALDQKINLVDGRLKELIALNAELTKVVALNRFFSIQHDISDTLISSHISGTQAVQTQLIADAANIKHQMMTSERPDKILIAFREKWINILRELGAKFVEF